MASLRDDMPETAAAIDWFRSAFGAEMVNAQIKKSMQGEPTFHAVEGDKVFGTKMDESGRFLTVDRYLALGIKPKQVEVKRGRK